MTTITSLYNSLPALEEATAKFMNRARIFSELALLLTTYEHKFDVCFVHAHCKLEEGEIMVASGHVSQRKLERDVKYYPECWLASGEPYEFTDELTLTPPPELFSQFSDIVDGINVLGLYAVSAPPSSGILLEWTDGRKNITEIVASAGCQDIETAWLPGTDNPLVMACTRQCLFDASPCAVEESAHTTTTTENLACRSTLDNISPPSELWTHTARKMVARTHL